MIVNWIKKDETEYHGYLNQHHAYTVTYGPYIYEEGQGEMWTAFRLESATIKKYVTQETSHGVAMAGCEVDARRVESRKKSEVKTLFLVTRTDIADYQECVSLVVRAKDEAEARKLALEGYAPYDPYSSKYAGLTPYNLKVDTIPVNDESGVVLDSWLE